MPASVWDSAHGFASTGRSPHVPASLGKAAADGQPLIIGGLVTRDISSSEATTPGLGRIPLLGKFFQSDSKGDTSRELIVVVTPTIVREAKHEAGLWQYPDGRELLDTARYTRSH